MATKENQNPKPSLPQDIIYYTLLKLPVKTLLRCMSVCKSWLSIISSDDFVKNHLTKSTNDPHFTHHHLFMDKNADPIFNICSVYSLVNEPVTEIIETSSPEETLSCVVGYCNGLVCLETVNNNIYLWNPSTRKSKKLPQCSPVPSSYFFCYDESDNDFKVSGTLYKDCKFELFVYSSKSDCWRKIGSDFPFDYVHYGVVYAKGAFYWVVDNFERTTIVCLDIKTGTYREVLQPKYAEGTYNATFCTFGKSLSVCYNVKESGADFWLMNNCGVEESWIKLFTMSHGNGLASDDYVEILCISANGDIILSSKSQILLYKSNNNTCEVLLDSGSEHNQVCTYVESLVSPNFKPEFWDSNK